MMEEEDEVEEVLEDLSQFGDESVFDALGPEENTPDYVNDSFESFDEASSVLSNHTTKRRAVVHLRRNSIREWQTDDLQDKEFSSTTNAESISISLSEEDKDAGISDMETMTVETPVGSLKVSECKDWSTYKNHSSIHEVIIADEVAQQRIDDHMRVCKSLLNSVRKTPMFPSDKKPFSIRIKENQKVDPYTSERLIAKYKTYDRLLIKQIRQQEAANYNRNCFDDNETEDWSNEIDPATCKILCNSLKVNTARLQSNRKKNEYLYDSVLMAAALCQSLPRPEHYKISEASSSDQLQFRDETETSEKLLKSIGKIIPK